MFDPTYRSHCASEKVPVLFLCNCPLEMESVFGTSHQKKCGLLFKHIPDIGNVMQMGLVQFAIAMHFRLFVGQFSSFSYGSHGPQAKPGVSRLKQ